MPWLLIVLPKLMMVPELFREPMLVIEPPEVDVIVTPVGMITVIPLGMVTLSDGPGIVLSFHVAGLFQFPFDTAVKEEAEASWLDNPVKVIIITIRMER